MERNNQEQYDIAIVGGGIVGAATFYQLARKYPQLRLLLLEKEDHLAPHQTGNNSGVIHSGLYYKPGSQKAKHCVEGRHELVAFAKEHGVAHDVCGKVVVATQERELPYMDKIFANGVANNTEGIEKISGDRVREIEPYCSGIAGIWVPCTGIIDFVAATQTMCNVGCAQNEENRVVPGTEVTGVADEDGMKRLITSRGSFTAGHTIFCTGLQADRMARKDGLKLKEKVVGFRGDYYELTDRAKHKVRNLIYPIPNPDFPFLGVHFTRMTDGEIECGPNAVFTFKREGYGKTDFNWRDTIDALSYIGTWRLFLGNIKFGLDEYRRAFSKKLFLKNLQRMIPSLEMDDIKPGRSGVRAMLLNEMGDTRDDFRIEYGTNSIHVLNAPSPAATASLAIGRSVMKMAEEKGMIGG